MPVHLLVSKNPPVIKLQNIPFFPTLTEVDDRRLPQMDSFRLPRSSDRRLPCRPSDLAGPRLVKAAEESAERLEGRAQLRIIQHLTVVGGIRWRGYPPDALRVFEKKKWEGKSF